MGHRRPRLRAPSGNRLLVPLRRPRLRHLPRPAQTVHQIPHARYREPDPEPLLDHPSDPRQRPPLIIPAVRRRPRRNSCSNSCSCSGVRYAWELPVRATSAPLPPSSHAACHWPTACRDTPSSRPTSACLTPCSNRSAARMRCAAPHAHPAPNGRHSKSPYRLYTHPDRSSRVVLKISTPRPRGFPSRTSAPDINRLPD